MAGRAPTKRRTRRAPPTSPISFRMPTPLRSRLRRFAKERSLGEAEALRLALSERLNQLDHEAEHSAAERWQFKQAYATWQEDERTGGRERVDWEELERIFAKALAQRRPRKRASE